MGEKNIFDSFHDLLDFYQIELDNALTALISQEIVYETLHALCQHLPGEQALECDSQVKTYLPKILQQTPGHLVSLVFYLSIRLLFRPHFRPIENNTLWP